VIILVVPAKAGTHTPCILENMLDGFPSIANVGGCAGFGRDDLSRKGTPRALGQWPTGQMKAESNRSFTID